jgi:hypothetical protein
MFEYIVWIEFTVKTNNEDFKIEALKAAEFNFDLGLQINETVELEDISIFWEGKTSYSNPN